MKEIAFTDHLAQKIDKDYGEFLNRRQIRELVELFLEEAAPVFQYQTYTELREHFTKLKENSEKETEKTVFAMLIESFNSILKNNSVTQEETCQPMQLESSIQDFS